MAIKGSLSSFYQGGGGDEPADTPFSGFSTRLKQRRAEEAKIAKAQPKSKQKLATVPKKQDFLGDVGNVVGGFGKAIVEDVADLAGRVGGAARILPGGQADIAGVEQQVRRGQLDTENLLRVLKDPKTPESGKAHIRKVLAQEVRSRAPDELRARILEETDPVRAAAAFGELGLTAATGGVGKIATTGGKLAAKQLVKQGASQVAQKAGSLAARSAVLGAEGATIGGLQDVRYGQTPGTGALVGGAIGGALPVLGTGFRAVGRLEVPTVRETRLGKAAAQTEVGKKITNLKDQFVAKVVDDTNYIKKPFKGIVNTDTGQKVTDEIEQLVTNVRQFAGKAQDRLQNNEAFQQLKPLIAGDKRTYRDYGNFIKSKQNAINANKLIESGKREGTKVPIPTGTPEQEAAYQLLNQATKDDVQYLFDNGIIEKAKYDKWIGDENYTRVQREVEDDFTKRFGSGLGSAGRVSEQKLKGSTKKAVDPFAAYEDWQRRATLEVERNNLRKYIRDQGLKHGKSNEVDTTSAGLDKIRQLYGEEGIQQKTLPVFEKGLKELYTLDPRAARQLASSSDLELRAIADWVLLPSRVLRGGATSMNAAFAVPNFIRDQVSSAIISKKVLSTHNPIAFWAGFKEAILKPTGKATLGRIPGVNKEVFQPSPLFKEYLSRNNNMTSVDLARNLKGATRAAQEQLGVKGENIIRKYENIISASEKATRFQQFFGTYKNALKNNVDPGEALNRANAAARTNSINFSNRGEIATFMKIFNPYFNAGVQGSVTLAKALKNRPLGTAAKIATGVLAPVATSVYYNLSDPERAEIYARIPDYERKSNVIMVLGGDQGYIKLPLPPGIKEFANPLRNYIESEYLGDRQGLLETAKDLFVDPFSPIGTTGNELVSQAIPQVIKPAVELGMNKELYTGREIIPENLKNLPKEEQVFDSTPQIYRDIGKTFGWSPLQVRKVITGYGAGGVEGALATLDVARGKESGARSTIEQIAKRFYGAPPSDSSNQVKSTFFETYSPLKGKKESVSAKVTAALKKDDYATANRLASDINNEIEKEKNRLREAYGRFETDLTPLYDKFDTLKFPLEDGELTERSIKSRLKSKY